jgi:exodeoxyribonuclease VII small subunit
MDFEKNLSRLEEIVKKMEKGELGLEESLKLFEEGVKISRVCQTELTQAEVQVKKLLSFDSNNTPITEDFNPSEEK